MSVIEVEPPRTHAPIASSAKSADQLCSAPAHVAHHFATATQQYDAAKLGMWLFLGTEILLFGGLFVLYAVLRYNKPEIFHYGSQFLDARLGAVNTVVLIMSSLTMALAVHAAQHGKWRLLVTCLGITVVGGAGFMGIKYIEYSHKIHEGLVLGREFYDSPDWVVAANEVAAVPAVVPAAPMVAAAPVAPAAPVVVSAPVATPARSPSATPPAPAGKALPVGDATRGKLVWDSTCRTCHGASGEGMPGSGKPIAGSAFVAGLDDAALLKFIKVGRAPADPLNTTGSQMPPKGGNPLLKDPGIMDVIAFMRTFPGSAHGASNAAAPSAPSTAPADAAATTTAAPAPAVVKAPEPFWIPKSSIPNAPEGPDGVSPEFSGNPVESADATSRIAHHTIDSKRPENAHQFFAIYYLMTGLHGIHVVIGMLVVSWLAALAMLGRFGPSCYTAVDLGGLYWHLVDLIWIFLFPLFYLL